MTEADEIEHMFRRAGIEHAWSRGMHEQLCLNVGPLGFAFDGAERLTGLLGDSTATGEASDVSPATSLRKTVRELRRLRDLAAVDLWPVYDRALRALESL
mgnify:FL=1